MLTYHQQYLKVAERWSEQVQRLAAYGFELSEARELIASAGARTEIFIKTAILPHLPPKEDLDGCINALKTLGVSKADRSTLHKLRQIYNDSKHDPSYLPSMLTFQELIPRIITVFQGLADSGVGLLNDGIPLRHNQVLWIAVWDHFTGGDSEVHVIAPATTGWPPELDLVYVDIAAWDQIKIILSTLGRLMAGEGVIPAQIYQSFGEDADFHEAIAFEGEYRTLIATLAAYERREDLIPGLRREDDRQAMTQAFVLALIDVASLDKQSLSSKDCATAISRRVVEAYAVPPQYRLLAAEAREVPENKRGQINGPIWVTEEEFQHSQAVSKHPRHQVLINDESTVLLRFPA